MKDFEMYGVVGETNTKSNRKKKSMLAQHPTSSSITGTTETTVFTVTTATTMTTDTTSTTGTTATTGMKDTTGKTRYKSSTPVVNTTPVSGEQKDTTPNNQSSRRRRRHSYKERSVLQRIFCLLRKLYSTTEEEDETDDFNIHVTRYRPEELAKLTKTTKFSKREIQLMYRGFKQECPTGLVDEDAFKGIFSQFFPQGDTDSSRTSTDMNLITDFEFSEEDIEFYHKYQKIEYQDATQYAHYVFNTIKHNSQGQISFEDFLKALSTVSRGTTQEKLQWIFGLYDVNHDGMITKTEMMDVVTAIYEMLGNHTEPQVEDTSAKDHVEKIFHLIDRNKDGAITIEELAEWVSRDDTIVQSLSMMDTVLYTHKENPHNAPVTRPSLSTP